MVVIPTLLTRKRVESTKGKGKRRMVPQQIYNKNNSSHIFNNNYNQINNNQIYNNYNNNNLINSNLINNNKNNKFKYEFYTNQN